MAAVCAVGQKSGKNRGRTGFLQHIHGQGKFQSEIAEQRAAMPRNQQRKAAGEPLLPDRKKKFFAGGESGLTFLRNLWYNIGTTCGFDRRKAPLVEAARFVWMHDKHVGWVEGLKSVFKPVSVKGWNKRCIRRAIVSFTATQECAV